MEVISEGIFEKYSNMKISGINFFEKGQILRPFFRPSTIKTKENSNKIKESFDTIFNMGWENHPWPKGL